jgi:hypothetical protein
LGHLNLARDNRNAGGSPLTNLNGKYLYRPIFYGSLGPSPVFNFDCEGCTTLVSDPYRVESVQEGAMEFSGGTWANINKVYWSGSPILQPLWNFQGLSTYGTAGSPIGTAWSEIGASAPVNAQPVQNLNIQAQIQNQFGEAITFNPATGIPGEIDFLNQSNTITPELGGVIKPNGYNNDGYGLYDGFGNKIVDIHHSQISLPQQAAGSGLHQCLHTDDNGIVTGTGSDCGSGGGGGVPSVNGVTTAVTIAAGAGIAVSTVGSTVSIASTGGGGGSPAAPDYSIQASNVGQTAFISDPTILIDTTNHAIDVGTLGTYKVTIAPQGTMTANWIFDTTSPATALASLGGGGGGLSGMTAGQIPVASSASAVTSSKALAGSGTGITTGPTATTTNDCVIFSNTMGQIADSGSPCGGGGGGGLASGAALVAPVVGFGTNSGWANYSFVHLYSQL